MFVLYLFNVVYLFQQKGNKNLEIMTNAILTPQDQIKIEDLFNYIALNEITIQTKEDLQLAMKNWVNDGVKFYHRMTKTNDGKIVGEHLFNDYLKEKGL